MLGQDAAGLSNSITLIDFPAHRTIAGMQTAIFFLVGAVFIPFLADEVKIILVNGKSRTAIGVGFPADVSPLAQWSLGVLLFWHVYFPVAKILNL